MSDDYYKKYERTIVIDIDDTISFAKTYADPGMYAEAEPNLPVIKTMQKLASKGYKFELFTSRGWISCEEDPERAKEKYLEQIEEWMRKHEVPYSRIIFGKPYGILYVDDKAMRPSEFVTVFNS